MPTPEARMRRLVDAGIALTSELSLDALLQRLVEIAAELTGARYVALGVLDRTGTHLERFITTGLSDEERARIGDLPQGRGILGALIRDAKPLRLHDLHEDPRSVGFPRNHPPMTTFLGVPVALRGVAYGNLYLTEKQGGDDFSELDEEAVTLLAGQAAVAIENARLYEAATRWAAQLESLNEVADALITEFDLPSLLQLVVDRLQGLIHASSVYIHLPLGDGARVEAVSGDDRTHVGMEVPHSSKTVAIMRRRRSERVDSVIDDPEIDQSSARRLGMRTALYVPLLLREDAVGVLTARDKLGPDPRFSDEDLRLAEVFAQRASVAVERSRLVARAALQRVVTAQEAERRRLARELHDETGQALTSILLGLRSVEEAADDAARTEAVAELRGLVRSTLQDVRQLAVDLRPSALDDFGLVPALERLTHTFVESTGIGVDFEAVLADRLPPELETALYRIVQESLTNVVKHARASSVSIVISRKAGAVTVVVEDDGVGFDVASTRDGGLGLVGMRERVGLLGGRLSLETTPDAGTTLLAEVPLP